MSRHGLLAVLSGLTAVLGACTSDLSPVQPIIEPVTIRIADSEPQELRLEAATDVPVLITLAARDVDIKAAVVSTNHAGLACPDFPLAIGQCPGRQSRRAGEGSNRGCSCDSGLGRPPAAGNISRTGMLVRGFPRRYNRFQGFSRVFL